jgi:protein-tyrosine phosphatase
MRNRDCGGALSIVILLVSLVTCAPSDAPQQREPVTDKVAHSRHVPLEGQPNFRDVGGYETADGRTVKWGQVYRSGQMPDLTDADVERLEALGLSTVVTFLVPKEIEKYGADRMPEGAREVRLPITGELAEELSLQAGRAIQTGDFSGLPADLNPEFHRLLLDDGREEYAALLRELSDPSNRPLVYHCSHGVHRTGTATAILLSALGVPWETIREDYLLSNVYRAEEIEEQLERIRNKVASDKGIPPEEVDMTDADAFFKLEGHYIDGTLEKAVEAHGSMEAYIRDGLRLTDEEIERLRGELLDWLTD